MQLPPVEPMHFFDKFLRGLKPKTRMEFELKYPQTLIEAIRLADSFDSIVYRKIILWPLDPLVLSFETGGEYLIRWKSLSNIYKSWEPAKNPENTFILIQ